MAPGCSVPAAGVTGLDLRPVSSRLEQWHKLVQKRYLVESALILSQTNRNTYTYPEYDILKYNTRCAHLLAIVLVRDAKLRKVDHIQLGQHVGRVDALPSEYGHRITETDTLQPVVDKTHAQTCLVSLIYSQLKSWNLSRGLWPNPVGIQRQVNRACAFQHRRAGVKSRGSKYSA